MAIGFGIYSVGWAGADFRKEEGPDEFDFPLCGNYEVLHNVCEPDVISTNTQKHVVGLAHVPRCTGQKARLRKLAAIRLS